jgi:hypothetical protein
MGCGSAVTGKVYIVLNHKVILTSKNAEGNSCGPYSSAFLEGMKETTESSIRVPRLGRRIHNRNLQNMKHDQQTFQTCTLGFCFVFWRLHFRKPFRNFAILTNIFLVLFRPSGPISIIIL